MKIDMAALPEESSAPSAEEMNKTALAVIPQADHTVAAYVEDEDAEGEFDESDRQRSTMVIVAKTGALADKFPPGTILVNKEIVIGGTTKPLDMVAVKIRKRYQNDLDFDGGEMGDVVDSATAVLERGGVVGYRKFDDKESTHFWKPILQVVFLIKMPEGLSPDAQSLFPYRIEDVDYGVFGFTARTKTAYNGIAKPLIEAKTQTASKSVRTSTYKLSTKGETWEGPPVRSWIQANLRVSGVTSDAIKAFLISQKP